MNMTPEEIVEYFDSQAPGGVLTSAYRKSLQALAGPDGMITVEETPEDPFVIIAR